MDIYNSHISREQFEALAQNPIHIRLWHVAAAVAVMTTPLTAYAFYLHFSA